MDGKKKIRFEISKELDGEFEELFSTSNLNGRILFFGDNQIPINEKKIKLESITSIELLEEVFSKEYTFVLGDPFYGYEKENLEKVCINDVKSVGMDALQKRFSLGRKPLSIPVLPLIWRKLRIWLWT